MPYKVITKKEGLVVFYIFDLFDKCPGHYAAIVRHIN